MSFKPSSINDTDISSQFGGMVLQLLVVNKQLKEAMEYIDELEKKIESLTPKLSLVGKKEEDSGNH